MHLPALAHTLGCPVQILLRRGGGVKNSLNGTYERTHTQSQNKCRINDMILPTTSPSSHSFDSH